MDKIIIKRLNNHLLTKKTMRTGGQPETATKTKITTTTTTAK
jgi:hypothetical protein